MAFGSQYRRENERAALATVYGWVRDGIPSRDHRLPNSVIGTRRLFSALRTIDLSTSDAETILDILSSRGFIVRAVTNGTSAAERFVDYLARFWDYDTSPYMTERKSHDHAIGRRHCYEMAGQVQRRWAPYFRDKLLGEITRTDLREFAYSLGTILAPKTRKGIMSAGTVALLWAVDNQLIPSNPAERLSRFMPRQ